MSNIEREPVIKLHFDMDGTLVSKVNRFANMRKYPTPASIGIHEFLIGLFSSPGAEPRGNIITRRPSLLRGRVTPRTIDEQGLSGFIDTDATMYGSHICGSKVGKASKLLKAIDQPQEVPHTVHSMLEDNPLDLVPEALCLASRNGVKNPQLIDFPKLVIGVVGSGAVRQIMSTARALDKLGLVSELENVVSLDDEAELCVSYFSDGRPTPRIPQLLMVHIPVLDGPHGKLYGQLLAEHSRLLTSACVN